MTPKKNVAKSVHQRLLNARDKTGERFNNLLVKYGLERLLFRLDASGHGNDFVLKGAMLFSLWVDVPGRPTRDMDLLGFGSPTHDRLRSVFSEACEASAVDDGLTFDRESIRTEDIRDDQEYLGVRIRLMAYLDRARVPLQIDVGFGDALMPEPQLIDYPAILDFPAPKLRAYHPATVIAEKVNAMVSLGALNSRMKDFYDVHVILNHMSVDKELLREAICATFRKRKMDLPADLPACFTPEFLEDGTKEIQWRAFLRRSLLSHCGIALHQVLDELKKRLWPIIQAEPPS